VNSCSTCRFYLHLDKTCRRRSPQVFAIPIPKAGIAGMEVQIQVMNAWPTVGPAGGCFEWEEQLD